MNEQNIAQEAPVITNGINATAIFETIDAVNENTEISEFRFGIKNKWMGGDVNRSNIKGFYGACEYHNYEEAFELDNAEPPLLLGEGAAANPVEYLLHALAGCVTTTMVYHSAAMGIEIEAIESDLEGDLDLRGFLGIHAEGSKGYDAVKMNMRIKTKATKDQLLGMAKFSPVYAMVSKAVPVILSVETY